MKKLTFALVVAAGLAGAHSALATPRPLPFTYTSEVLGEGSAEVEEYVDITPLRGISASSGLPVWYAATQMQTEFEYGLGGRAELGLYVTYVPDLASSVSSTATMIEGNGVKQRIRYAFADPGEWPIDIGVYGELSENDHEVEVEGKVLLQRRVGDLRIDANLWAEYELYYIPQRDVVLNPTLGMTYEFSPVFHLGAEGWVRAEFPDPAPHPRPFSVGPAAYVGPAVLLAFQKIWWSTGVYARVTDVDHTMQPGELYGPMWARTVIGFNL